MILLVARNNEKNVRFYVIATHHALNVTISHHHHHLEQEACMAPVAMCFEFPCVRERAGGVNAVVE
jgi:hypothetical protein